jgi:hypothetical protein
MRSLSRLTIGGLFAAGATLLVAGAGNDDHRPGGHCSIRSIEGLYGIQCSGFLPPVTPGATDVQPASFVGYTRTNARGEVEASFTLNTALGSLHSRASGTATLDHTRECIGTVVYDKNQIEVAPGVWVDGPPLSADFAIVHGGDELLGAPTAFPGQTGALVPRAACRLVRVGD